MDAAEPPVPVLWLVKGLGLGGAERLLVAAARVHDRAAFAIEAAYVLPWKDALVTDLQALGLPVRCLGADGHRLRWVSRLRALLASGRFAVVHAHSPLVASVTRLAAHTLPRSRRPRVVTTEHNAWSTFALPTRLLNAFTSPLDDATLAVSEQTRASMWWRRTRARTTVEVHGIDLAAVRGAAGQREATREELGLAPGEVVILTVANYRQQKAWPDLLLAARLVADRGLPVRFLAVGQGPLEAQVQARHRQLGLGPTLLLLGQRHDVPRLLAAADLFTLASTYEGYPLAVMEALAAGLPVVATAVGGVVEAVGPSAGVLVAPGRPDLLADALARLVGDPEERRRLARGARAAGDRYDVRRSVAAAECLYRRLLEE